MAMSAPWSKSDARLVQVLAGSDDAEAVDVRRSTVLRLRVVVTVFIIVVVAVALSARSVRCMRSNLAAALRERLSRLGNLRRLGGFEDRGRGSNLLSQRRMRVCVDDECIRKTRVELGRRSGERERLKHGGVFRRALRYDADDHLITLHLQR